MILYILAGDAEPYPFDQELPRTMSAITAAGMNYQNERAIYQFISADTEQTSREGYW